MRSATLERLLAAPGLRGLPPKCGPPVWGGGSEPPTRRLRGAAGRLRGGSLPLSPRMPSMLCLAFFSPSSSFLSVSSSSSFFPNLILSTRLIELTKPQKFKGKRASISYWGEGHCGHLGPCEKVPTPLPPDTLNVEPQPHLSVYSFSKAQVQSHLGHSEGGRRTHLCTPKYILHILAPCTITCPRCTHTNGHLPRTPSEAGPPGPAAAIPHSGVSQPRVPECPRVHVHTRAHVRTHTRAHTHARTPGHLPSHEQHGQGPPR